eukprot:192069_1
MNASVELQCVVNEYYRSNKTDIETLSYSMDIDIDAIDIKYLPRAFPINISSAIPGRSVIISYHMINGKCTDPTISVSIFGDFDGTHEQISINISSDGAHNIFFKCDPDALCVKSECISNIKTVDIQNQLNILIQPQFNDPICSYKNSSVGLFGMVTLNCISVETSPTLNESLYIDMSDTNTSDEYISFVYQIKSQKTAQDISISFITEHVPCYFPLITLDVLNLDFESVEEYLTISFNQHEVISNCRPSDNIQIYFNCIQDLKLQHTVYLNEEHSIHKYNPLNMYVEANNNNIIFTEALNVTISLLLNITIKCYIPPKESNANIIFVLNDNNGIDDIYHNYTTTKRGYTASYSTD